MKYRRIGDSGLSVSVISLGSWLTLGTAVEAENGRLVLRQAIEHGINFIDTADIYGKGKAEEFLGESLRDYRRADLVVATKAFWPMSDAITDRGLSRKHLVESCDHSLRRLQTDYIDLYQCHRADPDTPIAETVRAMSALIDQGKVLYWGTSCWTAAQIVEACLIADAIGGHRPISNQPHYSMLYRKIEAEILPVSARFGMGQVVWSPLEQGVLTGKYSGGTVPAESRGAHERHSAFLTKWLTPETLGKVDRLGPIARDLGITTGQLALAWTLRDRGVTSAITGASRAEQVTENIAAAAVTLSMEIIEAIDTILANKPDPADGV